MVAPIELIRRIEGRSLPVPEFGRVQYLGGKSRVGKRIAAYLNSIRTHGQKYFEPFVGSGSVLQWIEAGPNEASDSCSELIALWNALKRGWVPPEVVTEAEYEQARSGDCSPELRAFIGFGCAFGGKWFGGFARCADGPQEGATTKTYNYALAAHRSLLRKIAMIHPDTSFVDRNFFSLSCEGALIYCDPPYSGTTQYSYDGTFNSGAFWQRVRLLSERNVVVVSEYTAPDDFEAVLEFSHKTSLRDSDDKPAERTERLFRLEN